MKVSELIKILKQHNPDDKVVLEEPMYPEHLNGKIHVKAIKAKNICLVCNHDEHPAGVCCQNIYYHHKVIRCACATWPDNTVGYPNSDKYVPVNPRLNLIYGYNICDSCGGQGCWPLDPEDEKSEQIECAECGGTGNT